MLLRNKLTLITLLFFIVALSGLIYAFDYQSEIEQDNFATNASLAQESLWGKVVDGHVQHLEDLIDNLKDHEPFLGVLRNGDDAALRQFLHEWSSSIVGPNDLARMEFYKPNGNLFYSSAKSYFPAITLSSSDAQRLQNTNSKQNSGLIIDSERASMIIAPIAIQQDNQTFGLLVLAKTAQRTLDELKELSKAEIYLVNRRGRLLIGTNENYWDTLSAGLALNASNTLQTVNADNRYFSATLSKAAGALNPIGFIVSIQEITQRHQEFIRLQWVTYLAMAGFIIFAGSLLMGYLRQSLHPLNAAIQTLAGLSEGRYSHTMKATDGKDEVSEIGRSIIKFQRDLQRLERMKKSRQNRGKRQSLIIRREMSELADTLDENARNEVISDLQEVEEQLSKSGQEENSGTELAAMALTLSRLKQRIQHQHGELAQTILELEEALKSKTAYLALQQELAIGARVQLAMLPDDLPPNKHFHIAGKMQAAKEVGGDFYDFFELDENRLAIVIADVSGKGVPASLFMAITRSILRSTANMIASPAKCIERLNDELCDNNKEELFVTLLYGVLDLKEQTFTYTNAGHNPAYHLGENLEAIPLTGDIALGVMDEMDYSEHHIQLKEGDGLFFYTDGITEAMNPSDEEFGTPAMETVLNKNLTADAHTILETQVDAVDKFADGAAQADDITCVAIRIGSPKEI